MKAIEIKLRPGKEHLELVDFIKIAGLAQTGGMAGQLIKQGNITLNGEIETQKRKKLQNNDIILCYNEEFQLILI
jgi:ribosome-associated protein